MDVRRAVIGRGGEDCEAKFWEEDEDFRVCEFDVAGVCYALVLVLGVGVGLGLGGGRARRVVFKVPEEWAHVYEESTGLETVVDGFEVADDVWGGVEEEDGGDGVEGFCAL